MKIKEQEEKEEVNINKTIKKEENILKETNVDVLIPTSEIFDMILLLSQ